MLSPSSWDVLAIIYKYSPLQFSVHSRITISIISQSIYLFIYKWRLILVGMISRFVFFKRWSQTLYFRMLDKLEPASVRPFYTGIHWQANLAPGNHKLIKAGMYEKETTSRSVWKLTRVKYHLVDPEPIMSGGHLPTVFKAHQVIMNT